MRGAVATCSPRRFETAFNRLSSVSIGAAEVIIAPPVEWDAVLCNDGNNDSIVYV